MKGEHSSMAKNHKVGRDASTGKFIPIKEALRRPTTTVIETTKHNHKKS